MREVCWRMNLLENLNEQQKVACKKENNLLLIACPGSGKTRTIVHRLAYYGTKYATSRKINIAITYTNRASDEMENRLQDMGVDFYNIWTGTIHQFCMNFIIRPYSIYSERLRFGYRVIDEYEQREYGRLIAHDLGIDIKYGKYFENKRIVAEYKNRLIQNHEIDFNDILEISWDLLKDKEYIAENIAKLIRSINVDEYQDTNEYQYQILSLLYKANNKINLAFVGDANQAIYTGLGGIAKDRTELENDFDTSFEELYLSGCYRSTQEVIDFYSKFAVKTLNNIFSFMSEHKYETKIVYDKSISTDVLSANIASIIKEQLELGIKASEICVLAPQWHLLYPMANKLRDILPDVPFNAPDITPFKYDPLNPFYLMSWLLFSTVRESGRLRRKRATELLNILINDYGEQIRSGVDNVGLIEYINRQRRLFSGTDGIDCLKMVIENTFKWLNINLDKNPRLLQCHDSYFGKIENRIQTSELMTSIEDLQKCFQEKDGVVFTTIHAVKGEEYETVIAFGLLQGYLPNWQSIYDKSINDDEEAKRLLYVLFSRAKSNIYYFSETGRVTKKGKKQLLPTKQLIR